MADRAAKEEFVSGLSGTSLWEVSLVTLSLAGGYLVLRCSVVCVPAVRRATLHSQLLSFLLQFSTLVLPGILVFTVLADHAHFVLAAELALSLLMLAGGLVAMAPRGSLWSGFEAMYPSRLPCVTAARAYVNLFTAIAILAVDFRVFPRRFAKAETYGGGLMDVGVGAFMWAHGITAPEARVRDRYQKWPSLRGYLWNVAQTLRYVSPLLVLGLLRLGAVKSAGYQEHVTEYGAHWNFFFTIGAVRVLCSLLQPLFLLLPASYPHGLLGLTIALAYQAALSLGGGASYIVLGPRGDGSRPSLLSANREGLCSCAGYLAIYLACIELGRWLMNHPRRLWCWLPVLVRLVVLDALLWLLTSLAHEHVQPVSRRMANLPYILWTLSYTVMMLAAFLATDLLLLPLQHRLPAGHAPWPLYSPAPSPGPPHVCLILALDRHQLGFFLAANVLTGLANVSLDTLGAGPPLALALITGYMLTLTAGFALLHLHQGPRTTPLHQHQGPGNTPLHRHQGPGNTPDNK